MTAGRTSEEDLGGRKRIYKNRPRRIRYHILLARLRFSCTVSVCAEILLLIHLDRVEQPVCFRKRRRVVRDEGLTVIGLVLARRLAVPPVLVDIGSTKVGVDNDGVLLEVLGNAALIAGLGVLEVHEWLRPG
jgi:hypothetical protein